VERVIQRIRQMNIHKLNLIVAATLVAGCAAFFSVTGLGNLFQSFSVMVMAGSLEYAKLVTAAYLKKHWDNLGKMLRTYLSVAVIVLMVVTSMGIYGFLSDAFQQQSIRIEQVERQVALLENRININKSEISRYSSQNQNLTSIRNSQEQNLSKLIEDKRATGRMSNMIRNADNDILVNSKKIDSLNTLNVSIYTQIDSVKNQNIDLEKEVGGFRFVAESFNVPVKTAVKWFIIMIVFVFDPLAIALVLALNSKKKMIEVEESEIKTKYDKNWVVSMKEVAKKQRGRPKKYAQGNEELYIRHILATIGDGKFIVDLGAKEGFNQSTAKYFTEKGYKGLFIDSDENETSSEVKKHKIFSGNIIPLLRTYKCPKTFDLLNIDLNGTDYWVLKAVLENYKPRLIVAEFNASIENGKSITIPDDYNFEWKGDDFYGFSFEAGKRLGQEFGYTIVHQENNMNMFLVSNDYLKDVEVPEVGYEQTKLFPESESQNWIEV